MKKRFWSIAAACALTVAMTGCGSEAEKTEAADAAETETVEVAEQAETAVSSYQPETFDPAEVRDFSSHEIYTDTEGCDTFTQIVGKAENVGRAYTNTDIGDTNVLLMASGAYEYEEGFYAVIDAEIFEYNDDEPSYVGYLSAGGTAYPLSMNDGSIFVGGNHYMLRYTMEDGNLLLAEEGYISFDSEGTDTYYYRTADTDFADYGEEEASELFSKLMSEYNDGEVLRFDPIVGL